MSAFLNRRLWGETYIPSQKIIAQETRDQWLIQLSQRCHSPTWMEMPCIIFAVTVIPCQNMLVGPKHVLQLKTTACRFWLQADKELSPLVHGLNLCLNCTIIEDVPLPKSPQVCLMPHKGWLCEHILRPQGCCPPQIEFLL